MRAERDCRVCHSGCAMSCRFHKLFQHFLHEFTTVKKNSEFFSSYFFNSNEAKFLFFSAVYFIGKLMYVNFKDYF